MVGNRFRNWILPLLFVTCWFPPVSFGVEAKPDAADLGKCESCHGAQGDSASASIPRLNGQGSEYMLRRLKQFLDPTRGTPHATYQMWEVAGSLGDKTASLLAQYFSSQPPTPAVPLQPLAAKGVDIYRNGAGASVPACQSCHGRSGEGTDLAPRLAGQHRDYLMAQFNAFMLKVRLSPTMNNHALHLDSDQMAALAAFLGAR